MLRHRAGARARCWSVCMSTRLELYGKGSLSPLVHPRSKSLKYAQHKCPWKEVADVFLLGGDTYPQNRYRHGADDAQPFHGVDRSLPHLLLEVQSPAFDGISAVTFFQLVYSKFHAQVRSLEDEAFVPSSQNLPGGTAAASPNSSAPLLQPVRKPMVLVANKTDKETERSVSTAEGFQLAKELGCTYVETSAKDCVNVQKAFYDLVRLLRQQRSRTILPAKLEVPEAPLLSRPTGLTVASQFGRVASFLRLLQGVKINIREEYKHDAAHQAAVNKVLVAAARLNDLTAVKKCLANGAKPNANPGVDGSALHASAALGHAKILKFLLQNGAAPNAEGPRQVTALQVASAEGHRSVVELLLKWGAGINTCTPLHGTALLAAVSRGQVEVARILIKHRANVNVQGGQYGNALQAAAVVGKSEMARILLDAGASIEARGEGNCTALQAACNAGHAENVRMLLEEGADIDAAGGKFGYALQAANGNSRFDVYDLLLSNGASVENLGLHIPRKAQLASQSLKEHLSDSLLSRSGAVSAPYLDLNVPDDSLTSECKLEVENTVPETEFSKTSVPIMMSRGIVPAQPRAGSDLDPKWPLTSVEATSVPKESPSRVEQHLKQKSFGSSRHIGSTSFTFFHKDYTVACICPMAVELAPVEAMLEELHPTLNTSRSQNVYTLGSIGGHNIVVAVMPEIGNNCAAIVATQLVNDFPSIRFGLLVGIGGGIPGEDDIRLGDVVVSRPTATFGGVVQYDMGKFVTNGTFQRTGALRKPPAILSANVEKLKAQHRMHGIQIRRHLLAMVEKFPMLEFEYTNPGTEHDRLFKFTYTHRRGQTCYDCDLTELVHREERAPDGPMIHYGTIGSANAVIKDSVMRDRLQQDSGIICVEMEAAGLIETFPCLVIRGICDYADSHKNKRWQPYAAATAAAYMKDMLLMISPVEVTKESCVGWI
jgi:ankyrin repeat protein/nucleoside phosphorylase